MESYDSIIKRGKARRLLNRKIEVGSINHFLISNKFDIEADWWFPNSNIKFKGKLIFSEEAGGMLNNLWF